MEKQILYHSPDPANFRRLMSLFSRAEGVAAREGVERSLCFLETMDREPNVEARYDFNLLYAFFPGGQVAIKTPALWWQRPFPGEIDTEAVRQPGWA